MAKKTINAKDFYSNSLDEYLSKLKLIKPDEDEPLILKSQTTKEQAINAVEQIIGGTDSSLDKKFNKKARKQIAKKGVQPTVKMVYQNVLLTFFKTQSAEYDYSYSLNGDFINISPKRISINEGYAEFTTGTECFSGIKDDWFWENLKKDSLTEKPEDGYIFASLTQSDIDKDSKASMSRYNDRLKLWLKDFQQEELGVARHVMQIGLYDKKYSYTDAVLLAPYILVTYDLGKTIITFTVNAYTGKVETMLLNDPLARFDGHYVAPPHRFNPIIFVFAFMFLMMVGGLVYLVYCISSANNYKSASLHGYTLDEIRKLI